MRRGLLMWLSAAVVAGVVLPMGISAQTENSWPMVAGNPLRTSWTPEQVSGSLQVEAYRAVEAYIPQNVQIITANNLLYVSTARGLLVLYASDPDGNGSLRPLDIKWRFDTELPLGNSPTVDTATNVVYVGGYDRNLYAFNALDGTKMWQYAGATAGYSTNPVVADGKVMLGNRDGYFYAINKYVNSSNPGGTLAWRYKTDGPINFSAAHKNGVVYFASMDNRGYALNTTSGSLVWRTSVMGGDGFQSYWPVIYTEPVSGQDHVIFAASSGYRPFYETRPGIGSMPTCDVSINFLCSYPEWADEWRYNFNGNLANQVSLSDAWVQGKQVWDYNKLSQYFEENPNGQNPDTNWHKAYRRFYYIYNTQNGQEWSMDTDGDGFREYTPLDPILSNSGNVYPPVALNNQTPDRRLLYFGNHNSSNTTSMVGGWRMGTNFMAAVGLGPNNGDEPMALSAGGNVLYRNIINARTGDMADTTSGGAGGQLFGYINNLDSKAPGYDEMWYYTTNWTDYDGLVGYFAGIPGPNGRASSGSQNPNGIYGNHGDMNPLVPYNGKIYTHRANSIIVFGNGSQRGKITPYVATNPVRQTLGTPSTAELTGRLEAEVQKIVGPCIANQNWSACHLRPGYYNAGQQNATYPGLRDYFAHPGDTLYALSIAYPYVTNTQANSNLKDNLKNYLKYEFANFNRISWSGAKREWSVLPPEVETDMASGAPVQATSDSYYNYALWKYVQNVAPEDRQAAIAKTTGNGAGMDAPYNTYRSIAGTIGSANLNNQTPSFSCPGFSKDSPFGRPDYVKKVLNISRNFLFMVPELAAQCFRNSTVTSALAEYEKVGPYWFVSRYTASVGESTTQNLYDYPSLFLAKAKIQQLPREELTKWLDVPAFKVGDLFYIQNLVLALEAPSTGGGPTNVPTPPTTAAPTPTPASGPGDGNQDGRVDGLDYVIWVNNYGQNTGGVTNGDFNNDNRVDGLDYVVWLNNYGNGVPTPVPTTAATPTPTPAGPTPTTQPGLPPGSWTMTFNDEFNGTTLDRTKWATKMPYSVKWTTPGKSDRTTDSSEIQWYLDDVHVVNNGVLSLTVRRECIPAGRPEIDPTIYNSSKFCNGNYTSACTDNGPYSCTNFPYTSGMIASFPSFSQRYGYFETRMKLPTGAGLWPAFWLMPQAPTPQSSTPWPWSAGFWPPEIDIMESIGERNTVYTNVHYAGSYPAPGSVANNWLYGNYQQGVYSGPDFSAGFHTFGLDWQQDLVTWYVDGVARWTRNSSSLNIPPGSLSPGNMYMIASMAVGGPNSWPGLPNASTVFPQSLEVDYIRVYQRTGQPTPTPIPAQPTATPGPGGTIVVDFQSYTGPETLSGEYPAGSGVNWGSGQWLFSGPWEQVTNSVYFASTTANQGLISFASPKILDEVTVYNGNDTNDSTVSVSCAGNPQITRTVVRNTAPQTITTNWSNACSSVTITASTGQDTNFDNITVR